MEPSRRLGLSRTNQGLEGLSPAFHPPLPHLGPAQPGCRKEARRSLAGSDRWHTQPEIGLHGENVSAPSWELCRQQLGGGNACVQEASCQMSLERWASVLF